MIKISDFIKLKSDDTILMNNIHEYRKKIEINSMIEKQERKENASQYFIRSRQSKNSNRYSYVNLSSDKNPTWHIIKDDIPGLREKVIIPNINYKSPVLSKNLYLCNTIEDLGLNVQTTSGLNVMDIFYLDYWVRMCG